MSARVAVVGRDAHEAVHSALPFQVAVGEFTVDLERAGFDPRRFALGQFEFGDLEAVLLRPHDVHTHEHGSPVLAFGTACARVDVDDGAEVVLFEPIMFLNSRSSSSSRGVGVGSVDFRFGSVAGLLKFEEHGRSSYERSMAW